MLALIAALEAYCCAVFALEVAPIALFAALFAFSFATFALSAEFEAYCCAVFALVVASPAFILAVSALFLPPNGFVLLVGCNTLRCPYLHLYGCLCRLRHNSVLL